jgi:hypothetical protein
MKVVVTITVYSPGKRTLFGVVSLIKCRGRKGGIDGAWKALGIMVGLGTISKVKDL